MDIQAIIFDLGGTLIEYAGPYAVWPDLETPGLKAAYSSLAQNGTVLPSVEEFSNMGFDLLPRRWQMATSGERNLRLVDFLAELLQGCGVQDLPQDRLAAAAQLYENAICMQAFPMDGAQETLASLKRSGYRLGLLSNTMFSGAAHIADLKRFDLDGYFDAVLFSADAGKWKPSPEPFLDLVSQLKTVPENCVFVGDDPANDVVGAQRAGLRSVLIRSSQRFQLPDQIRPEATIVHLSDLKVVLTSWSNEK